ncbi:sigma-70 family RNA polymerase sigma factor [Candidatus Poribacteria bacterium]|nr:sigma-70 family RNA polymerase sigma factor [Candidatus Poribacteria bacterium]
MDDIRDRDLIINCQNGDPSSFRGIVERYQNKVYSTAFRIVGNSYDAEDVAQEAFLTAYKAIDIFDTEKPFSPWITRITVNMSIDFLRRQKSQKWLLESDDNDFQNMSNRIKSEEPDPLEKLEAWELLDMLGKLIENLPTKYRVPITLYHIEDMTYDEISEFLEIPMGTLKTYLYRGKEALKAMIRNEIAVKV